MNPRKVVVVFFAFLTFTKLIFTPTLTLPHQGGGNFGGNPAFAEEDYVFEDASEFGYEILNEEEEEVFFHRGKFINVGARGGLRFFTEGLGNLYDLGPAFGIFGAYFFSFTLAGELAFDASFHRFKLTSGQTGTMTLLDILLRLKYYPFSETTVKALADSNPYLSIGAGEYFRLTNSNELPSTTKQGAFGLDFGLGGEVPISERALFLGGQFVYHLIFFGDESEKAKDGTSLRGDAASLLAVLTYNF